MSEKPEDRYPLYVHHPRPDFPADGGEYRPVLWHWTRTVYAVAPIPPEALLRQFKIRESNRMHGHWPSHICDAIEEVVTDSIRELPPHSPEEKIDEAHFAFLRDWVHSVTK